MFARDRVLIAALLGVAALTQGCSACLNREHLRWQTELEYTHKGAREKELIDPFIGTRSGGFSTNKYTYIQWNNYLDR